ncbi:MAG: ParA family protein [Candidatus Pelagibacterales bacterium]|jgi:chromosome partitioning protein|tara:strand:+ start:218 stop:1006 length:789 start_codon:yes stop_codon:yes gene_type:complete
MRSNIIAICNQKGGVGKTTTAINLAAALAATGKKILIIDLDPQGNASTGLGIDYVDRNKSIYEVLAKSITFDESVKKTDIENLFVIPSNVELSGIEPELANENDKAFVLKKLINNSNSINVFDYIFIDCPPALSLLTVMAMTAANSVLVPLQCEFFALEGLSQLIKTVDRVHKNLNPLLSIDGIILTMFDKRNKLSTQVAMDVKKHLQEKVFETMIPRNVRVSEAPSFGMPVIIYDRKSKGSQAYLKLAAEILKKDKSREAA